MIGAGLNPVPDRVVNAIVPTDFYQAFLAITNPVRISLRFDTNVGSIEVLARFLHMRVSFSSVPWLDIDGNAATTQGISCV